MPGGLLQLASAGIQDKYLTHLPQITFFKSVYRRHTMFALEMREVPFDINPEYEDTASVTLPASGDLVYRIYLSVDIPSVSFTDNVITNNSYKEYKNAKLSKLKRLYQDWKLKYDYLKTYADYQINIYQEVTKIFLSENYQIVGLKNAVLRIKKKYTSSLNSFLSTVDEKIRSSVDIVDLVLSTSSLDQLSNLESNVEKRYNKLLKHLKIFYFNYLENFKEYNKIQQGNVKTAWTKYLGNYLVENFEIEIGGQIIDNYSADQFHLYMEHSLTDDKKDSYYNMIGHVEDLYQYQDKKKDSYRIYIPLIFWFNRNCGSALPIVAMKYSDIKLNFKFNKLKNLIYFENWEQDYQDHLTLKFDPEYFSNYNSSIPGFLIDNNIFRLKELTKDVLKDQIIYKPEHINKFVLKYHYPSLTDSELDELLINYGTTIEGNTDINQYYIEKYKWKLLHRDIDNLSYGSKIKTMVHYLDKNSLLSQVNFISSRLLVEYVYLDDIEREKFADSNLEYIIETFEENEFSINQKDIFINELSFGKTIKELMWFIQPKLSLEGITLYDTIERYKFGNWDWQKNKIIKSNSILLNQVDLFKNNNDLQYYQLVTSYQNLNSPLPEGVNYYSFSLFPEEMQPSGTANFSVLKKKVFQIYFNNSFLKEYFSAELNPNSLDLQLKVLARSYNIFNVNKGAGKLLFY